MHISQGLTASATPTAWPSDQARLHRALRDAAKVCGLSDSVAATATSLICFIPSGAPAPVSPVQVQRLADDRNCDPRTVRNHIAQLVGVGIVKNACKDGGGRGFVRAGTGEIVSIHGISFAPLLADAERLAEKAAEINAMATEKARLRAQISALRRRIKRCFAIAPPSAEHRGIYDRLPRRVAHLELGELDRLWGRLEDLYQAVLQAGDAGDEGPEPALGPVETSDRSETPGRQFNTTTGPKIIQGNRHAIQIARQSSRNGPLTDRERQELCGLEHIHLKMALQAVPKEWQASLVRFDRPSWASLATIAYEQAPRLGISPTALALAHAAIGRIGTTLLVIVADANRVERGGSIRNPGAWLRRMAERAERGEAHIHRSIFGILNRDRGPECDHREL